MKRWFPCLLLITLLGSCAPVTPVATATTKPTVTAVPTQAVIKDVFITHPELEAITPENVDQLELINRWGKGNITDWDVTPDGSILAASTSTGVYLFDDTGKDEKAAQDGVRLWEWEIELRLLSGQTAFSPDGAYLAIADKMVIKIWDIAAGKVVKSVGTFTPSFSVIRVEYSNTGKQVMFWGYTTLSKQCETYDGSFYLYDIESGRELYSWQYCAASGLGFQATNGEKAFLTRLVPGRGAFETQVVDTATGKVLRRIPEGFQKQIYGVSPDGELVAVYRSEGAGLVTDILKADTLEVVKSLEGGVVFLSDSRYLVQKKGDNPATGWVLQDSRGNELCKFTDGEHQLNIPNIFDLPSYIRIGGHFFATEHHQNIEVWDTDTCRLTRDLPIYATREYESRLVFSPDGRSLASEGSFDVDIWDTATGDVRTSLAPQPETKYKFYSFHPTRQEVVIGPPGMYFFDTTTGELLKERSGLWYERIAFSPDGAIVAILEDNRLRLLDLAKEETIYSSDQFASINSFNSFESLFFNSDGSRLAAALRKTGQSEVLILDVNSLNIEKRIEFPSCQDFALSPDMKIFACADEKGYIYIWDVDKERLLFRLVGNHDAGNKRRSHYGEVMFSPAGDLLISMEDSNVRFWDIQTGRLVGEIASDYSITSLAFSPDGYLLATTGRDGTIRIWGVRR